MFERLLMLRPKIKKAVNYILWLLFLIGAGFFYWKEFNNPQTMNLIEKAIAEGYFWDRVQDIYLFFMEINMLVAIVVFTFYNLRGNRMKPWKDAVYLGLFTFLSPPLVYPLFCLLLNHLLLGSLLCGIAVLWGVFNLFLPIFLSIKEFKHGA